MPDPVVTLDGERLTVKPGGQARASVTVRNPGTLVQGYRLDVVGEGVAGWAEVVPPEVNVYPGEEATAAVVVSPPAGGAAPSGVWPYGLRARSVVDPDGSAVAEGEVEVGAVFGLQAKLVPVTSSARWRGRHVVELSNWGNAPARLRLQGSDADAALGFLARPPVVDLPVGGSASARLWVRARRSFLRGTPVRLPFTVACEPEGVGAATPPVPGLPMGGSTPDRPVVDGALNQKPILTRGAVTATALALALAGAGVVWALTRPDLPGAGLNEAVPPAQPIDVKAVPTGPDTVNVTWAGVAGVKEYRLPVHLGRDGAVFKVETADGDQTSATVKELAPRTEFCIQVQGVGLTLEGPPSDQACATTAAAPASPSPSVAASPGSPSPSGAGVPSTAGPGTGTGSGAGGGPNAPASSGGANGSGLPGPGQWIAAAEYLLVDSLNAPVTAKLREAGLDARELSSSDYPTLPPPPVGPATRVIIVYLGPYATQAEAQQTCDKVLTPITSFCRVLQPVPG